MPIGSSQLVWGLMANLPVSLLQPRSQGHFGMLESFAFLCILGQVSRAALCERFRSKCLTESS